MTGNVVTGPPQIAMAAANVVGACRWCGKPLVLFEAMQQHHKAKPTATLHHLHGRPLGGQSVARYCDDGAHVAELPARRQPDAPRYVVRCDACFDHVALEVWDVHFEACPAARRPPAR